MATELKEKKSRGKRRNYAKDWERLTFFLETIIRVKAPDDVDDTHTGDHLKGQLKAYRDVQSYMSEGR